MVKEKKRKSYGIEKIEDKYICQECQAEVPVHQDCPACKKHVEWDRYFAEINSR
jgi:hypothetical protein